MASGQKIPSVETTGAKYAGAYVLDPYVGNAKAPIAVGSLLDFQSLYPSILQESKALISADSKLPFDWRWIDVDDYVCDWNGYLLRVEQMGKHHWWWAVSHDGKDISVHDHDMFGSGFPAAKTWQDACYFATLVAKHLVDAGPAVPLVYLTHAKPPRKQRPRQPRGPRYAFNIFPPHKTE